MPPDAIARAIAFAIEQPADNDVNERVIVREYSCCTTRKCQTN
jgi:NADP-dependent 3-hydroxy acid dehydrogenase YdfG